MIESKMTAFRCKPCFSHIWSKAKEACCPSLTPLYHSIIFTSSQNSQTHKLPNSPATQPKVPNSYTHRLINSQTNKVSKFVSMWAWVWKTGSLWVVIKEFVFVILLLGIGLNQQLLKLSLGPQDVLYFVLSICGPSEMWTVLRTLNFLLIWSTIN